MELTKDADKLICCIYKEYLEKRKSGNSKVDSKNFSSDFYKNIKVISSWNSADISDTLRELKTAGFIKLYLHGSFVLNDNAIIYMENRFKAGITEVTKYIADLVSDIATGLIL